jgi:MoxR-like ATPase
MQHQTPAASGITGFDDADSIGDAAGRVRAFRDVALRDMGQIVVGLDAVSHQLLIALAAGGHVLMEGVPGTAKTTLCKTFAQLLGVQFHRIQFTPDLLPSDVTGTFVFDRSTNEFVLRRGPIFCQVLLADELNRAPAKTQSALLEAMQESQVTIEGHTLPLPPPFLVLATQNPVEQEGVYRLPEAQLDRFLLRVEVGYPHRGSEIEMLEIHGAPRTGPAAITSPDEILGMQQLLRHVHATREVREYVVDVARATRDHPDIALGASPRAALYMLQAARARALLDGRGFVTHEDVQWVLYPVLGHRLILRPEAEVEERQVRTVIDEITTRVPVTA